MAYDKSINRTVLFGGGPFASFTDRTWEYDGTDWTEILPDVRPPPTIDHCMVYDSKRKHIVMFGGSINYGVRSDGTWFYFGASSTTETPTIRTDLLIVLLCLLPLVLFHGLLSQIVLDNNGPLSSNR